MKSLVQTTSQMLAFVLAAISILAAVCSPAHAAPILKFSQLPMLDTPLVDDAGFRRGFHGHDELSTAWRIFGRSGTDHDTASGDSYRGQLMADDFADRSTSPVFSVRWWGSYLNGPLQGVDKFLISFAADVPAVAGTSSFSHPGAAILSQVVSRGTLAPGSGTFTEQQVYPLSVDGPIYEYNAELHLGKEFQQQPDTVYWLTIAALVDTTSRSPLTDPNVVRWGWHNRDYTIQNTLASVAPAVAPGERADRRLPPDTNVWHFQDDAVSGALAVSRGNQGAGFLMPRVQQSNFLPENYQALSDGPIFIETFSKDLAFELYTVPEPASIWLCCLGFALVVGSRTRQRP